MFGRKGLSQSSKGNDPGLQLQRDAHEKTLAYFLEFDGRVATLDGLAEAYVDVWEETPEIQRLRRNCAASHKVLGLIGQRLSIATAPLPDVIEPMQAIIQMVDKGQTLMEDLVTTLALRQALRNSTKDA
jgi:hypothetical protein